MSETLRPPDLSHMTFPFDFDTERTGFSDEAYAAVGRALAFATRFEANCRALAQLLHIRPMIAEKGIAILDDDVFITNVVAFLRRPLKKNLSQVCKWKYHNHKLSEDTASILAAGREARNLIAHEITLSVPDTIQTDSGRAKLMSMLQAAVQPIAEADRIVCLITHVETHEPLPTAVTYDTYIQRITDWVCDVPHI